MKYLSDSVMLDTLNKVQVLQVSILKAGYSADIDASVRQNWMDVNGRHISFELVIFEDNEIIRSFEFSSSDSDGILNATYDLVVAYVKYLENV